MAELLVFAVVFPTLYLFGQRAFLASILIASAVSPFIIRDLGRKARPVTLCAPWGSRRRCCCVDLHRPLVGAATAAALPHFSRIQDRRRRSWRHRGISPADGIHAACATVDYRTPQYAERTGTSSRFRHAAMKSKTRQVAFSLPCRLRGSIA